MEPLDRVASASAERVLQTAAETPDAVLVLAPEAGAEAFQLSNKSAQLAPRRPSLGLSGALGRIQAPDRAELLMRNVHKPLSNCVLPPKVWARICSLSAVGQAFISSLFAALLFFFLICCIRRVSSAYWT
jgi:hypothetical protein